MSLRPAAFLVAACSVVLFAHTAHADVKLPTLVSDGMVLQARAPVRVWGWASEGESVRVTFRGQTAVTRASGGRWSATLRPMDPGGPFVMSMAG
jgi:sialate O-acetylesterase